MKTAPIEQTAFRGALSRGWKAPLLGALFALAIAYAVCVGLVALGQRTIPSGDERTPRLFRQAVPLREGGAATFYGFQRVPMNLHTRESTTETVDSDSDAVENTDARIVFSPIGGLLLVGLALILGGVVAWRIRDPQEDNPLVSASRMAILFAVTCFCLSFILPLGGTILEPQSFARRSTRLTYEPSHLGAIVWPLVWSLVFGSIGISIARHGRKWRTRLIASIEARTPAWANALRASLFGLATGLGLVLLAGILTAVVGIAFHPSQTGEVLGSGKNVAGIAEGVVLGLPHATGAGLLGTMGVPGHYEFGGEPQENATASIFSGERQRRIEPELGFGPPTREPFDRYDLSVPRYALGGLAIAVIFTVLTGFRAARSAGTEALRAIRSAIMAASLLTVFLWIIAYLVGGRVSLVFRMGRSEQLLQGWAGPTLVEAVVLPLLWTIGGGLLGAFLSLLMSRYPRDLTRRDTPAGG